MQGTCRTRLLREFDRIAKALKVDRRKSLTNNRRKPDLQLIVTALACVGDSGDSGVQAAGRENNPARRGEDKK